MKIIFLDIDGVLNSAKDFFSIRLETDSHFILLKELVDETDSKLVLSSSWRLCPRDVDIVRNRLQEFDMDIIDCTPYIKRAKRGDEIKEWLTSHKEVTDFFILDDEDDMGELISNLVQTDPMEGLQRKDIDKILEVW